MFPVIGSTVTCVVVLPGAPWTYGREIMYGSRFWKFRSNFRVVYAEYGVRRSRFMRSTRLHPEALRSLTDPWTSGGSFLRNTGAVLPGYTASHAIH